MGLAEVEPRADLQGVIVLTNETSAAGSRFSGSATVADVEHVLCDCSTAWNCTPRHLHVGTRWQDRRRYAVARQVR
jgi:hypothetical protein